MYAEMRKRERSLGTFDWSYSAMVSIPSKIIHRNISQSVIVFDVGGTWFRSGVFTSNNELVLVSRQPAISFKNTPNTSFDSLKAAFVDYILGETYRLRSYFQEDLKLVGISIGAALNAHTSLIFNSGPIWGAVCEPFDLLSVLRQREPLMNWIIVNDITAALLHHMTIYEQYISLKLMLVTISTGVGCRIYDNRSQTIPVDTIHGLQGEIGHIPIKFEFKGSQIDLVCDCGGLNHLNAFCSGRGIEDLTQALAVQNVDDFQKSHLFKKMQINHERITFKHFADAVAGEDTFANDILDAVTLPIAQLLINLFTFDPEVERVILVGGVIHTLAEKYLNSLLKHLNKIGLYQISLREPAFFEKRVVLGKSDDNAGLIGAAIAAKTQSLPNLRKSGTVFDSVLVRESELRNMDRWSIRASLPITYDVVETNDLFALDNREILLSGQSDDIDRHKRIVLIDEVVDTLYGDRIRRYFSHHNTDYFILSLNLLEQKKNIDSTLRILQEIDALGVSRRGAPIIAIGGGVLLDVAGLAASLFRRGVPYIRVPTTLLSLVDAGIGAKVGVNFYDHKNRIGTYYPPLAVFLDKTFLQTLDSRQICSGMAEILKLAIVRDRELFELLEKHGSLLIQEKFQDTNTSRLVIRRAVHGMLEELAPNLWEQRLERLMDFGHSFSPAIEMHALPDLLHGEAVSIDIAITCSLANQRGLLNAEELTRVFTLMKTMRLPITHSICDPQFLHQALQDIILHRSGLQRFPLPVSIGSARFFNDITFAEIETAVYSLKQYMSV
jgi:3-dehydroquinate synthetase/predicted NBD/HSP70 family sugar kinase